MHAFQPAPLTMHRRMLSSMSWWWTPKIRTSSGKAADGILWSCSTADMAPSPRARPQLQAVRTQLMELRMERAAAAAAQQHPGLQFPGGQVPSDCVHAGARTLGTRSISAWACNYCQAHHSAACLAVGWPADVWCQSEFLLRLKAAPPDAVLPSAGPTLQAHMQRAARTRAASYTDPVAVPRRRRGTGAGGAGRGARHGGQPSGLYRGAAAGRAEGQALLHV